MLLKLSMLRIGCDSCVTVVGIITSLGSITLIVCTSEFFSCLTSNSCSSVCWLASSAKLVLLCACDKCSLIYDLRDFDLCDWSLGFSLHEFSRLTSKVGLRFILRDLSASWSDSVLLSNISGLGSTVSASCCLVGEFGSGSSVSLRLRLTIGGTLTASFCPSSRLPTSKFYDFSDSVCRRIGDLGTLRIVYRVSSGLWFSSN